MPFDTKCYELAQYFYPDQNKEFQAKLAEAIQELVENMDPDAENN